MAEAVDPIGNRLLAAIPTAARGRLVSGLQLVTLEPGVVLGRDGSSAAAYFPLHCVLSLTVLGRGGDQVGTVLIGRDGMLGLDHVLGRREEATHAVVRLGGDALRVNRTVLAEECRRQPELQRVLLSYAGWTLGTLAQLALCYRHHTPEQQLCGLLLVLHGLTGREDLPLTHEAIAGVLGLRRETISQAATRVQARGGLRSGRGHIHVVDRAGLARVACECHQRWHG
ncbi:MAG TPA: Crp/Fnr family transcriptional regulator [Ramlibacter sp.]|nr:Crp/Fnr family transcriptional regulator [Ramlibacter sp.]